MAVTGTFSTNVRMDSENYLTGSVDVSSDAGYKTSDVIVNNNVAQTAAIPAFLTAKLEGFYIQSDEDMTLSMTMTSGFYNQTLTADVPIFWFNGTGTTCPIANNCVSVTGTCNATNNATLTARIWVNA